MAKFELHMVRACMGNLDLKSPEGMHVLNIFVLYSWFALEVIAAMLEEL